MASKAGYIQSDALFLGLTRPPMFLGVSFSFVVINGFCCLIYFINTSNFNAIILMVILHLIAYIICFKEPLFIELILMKAKKCNFCKNRMYHGANSYDLF
jgi:type IV secretion system protein VirB3